MQRDRPMIRVEREVKGKNGKYRYRITGIRAAERPFPSAAADACRAVLAMGGDPSREIGLFRELRAPAHQPAVASYVGRENGREWLQFAPFPNRRSARPAQKSYPISARPEQKRENPLLADSYGHDVTC